jgi:hypothetical protein
MMNSTLMMLRAAARSKSSTTRTSVLLSLPSLTFLERRCFSSQMQMGGKSRDNNEMLHPHTKITPPFNSNKNSKDQLMAGYREYLDQMMDKTSKIESSMQALRETSLTQKKQYAATTGTTTIKWTDASEIDKLFDESVKHKDDISTELAKLQSILHEARQEFYYGVDAPDGEGDWHVREEMQEIKHIIDNAAVLEDKDEVMRRHKMEAEAAAQIYAVDAPDGESDGYVKEHLNAEMQLKTSILQQVRLDAQDFHGVDAPDGVGDWHVREEIQEVSHIIDDAAILEDKDEVVRRHKLEAEAAARIFAVDAPNGESDGYVKEHLKEEMQEIKDIIDFAAVAEDQDEVVQRHKIYAVDAPDGDSDGHVLEKVHEVQHIIDNTSMLKEKKTASSRKHKM